MQITKWEMRHCNMIKLKKSFLFQFSPILFNVLYFIFFYVLYFIFFYTFWFFLRGAIKSNTHSLNFFTNRHANYEMRTLTYVWAFWLSLAWAQLLLSRSFSTSPFFIQFLVRILSSSSRQKRGFGRWWRNYRLQTQGRHMEMYGTYGHAHMWTVNNFFFVVIIYVHEIV
jgi:hypothetical protein